MLKLLLCKKKITMETLRYNLQCHFFHKQQIIKLELGYREQDELDIRLPML